jgi:hypothetical protein
VGIDAKVEHLLGIASGWVDQVQATIEHAGGVGQALGVVGAWDDLQEEWEAPNKVLIS